VRERFRHDDGADPVLFGGVENDRGVRQRHGCHADRQPAAASSATPLLIGSVPDKEPEPIAYTNLAGPKKARVFYTSFGHPEDFKTPQFRKLLVNAIFWTTEPPYREEGRVLKVATK